MNQSLISPQVTFLSYCLSIWLFCLVLLVSIFLSEIVLFLCHPVVSMSSSSPPYLMEELFSLFWNVLFCLYSFILSQYLFSLPSFASFFRFVTSSYTVRFTCFVAFFLCSNTFQRSTSLLQFLDLFLLIS